MKELSPAQRIELAEQVIKTVMKTVEETGAELSSAILILKVGGSVIVANNGPVQQNIMMTVAVLERLTGIPFDQADPNEQPKQSEKPH